MPKFKPKNFKCKECDRTYYRWISKCYGCENTDTLEAIDLSEAESNKIYQEIKQALIGTGLYVLIEEIEDLRKSLQNKEMYIGTLEEKCKWGEQQYALVEHLKQERDDLKVKVEEAYMLGFEKGVKVTK